MTAIKFINSKGCSSVENSLRVCFSSRESQILSRYYPYTLSNSEMIAVKLICNNTK